MQSSTVCWRVQESVSSAFSEPISSYTGDDLETPQSDALPAGLASSSTDVNGDMVPLWIVFPLCAAVVVVIGFVIAVVLIR